MINSSNEIILTNTHIILSNEIIYGSVKIRDGCISEIDDQPTSIKNSIDLEGDFLLPGLIELHTDNLERHCVPRPSVLWPFHSAVIAHDAEIASAGITTVFDAIAVGGAMLNKDRDTVLIDAADAVRDAVTDKVLRVDHYLHMRCEVASTNVIELFNNFCEEPLVQLVSLMDHTPGERQFVDEAKLKVYYQGKYGLSDSEFDKMVIERKELQAKYSKKHRLEISSMCKNIGVTTATHDDATEAHIKEAITLGATISEFPTTVAAASAANNAGMSTIMGGPNVVRGGSHSGNVSAADLSDKGLLDALSSDYVPSSLLYGAFLLSDKQGLSLPDAIATVTTNPARMANFNDRGEIKAGLRADLIQVKRCTDGTPIVRKTFKLGERVA
ncbi:MAG: phosphonate metabolism protein PhnM [Rhodospirillaceae bacterium]|jgi:alpha-D-ribose 1-methylphosphonate 5-triphosphate diphosphatase|nr:phosphonate metabolism protein PhnM [Rhodospirillaceae bacterium]OUU58665.1 MAG: phosphonate metabolism protein PhnM [Candidatus Endolissoclinum sp. TMED55]|tara:strand:- start:497 stop:1651 length:1155 start_codon:yes stop_codon:yes gene_type:complete